MQLGGSHFPKRDQDCDVRQRVDKEAHARAGHVDHSGGDRWPDNARPVENSAVEANRVGQVLLVDQFRHKRLPRRLVDRGCTTRTPDQDEDAGERDRAGKIEHTEKEREQSQDGLRLHEQLAFVDAVRQEPAPNTEQQRRQILHGDACPRGNAVVVAEVQHQDRLRDGLRPRAGDGNDLTGKPEAVVPDLQGSQGGRERQLKLERSRTRLRAQSFAHHHVRRWSQARSWPEPYGACG